ncbi:unnamed protein product [Cuscuta europaea]|uniref:Uncharacterized protein n=1 Tax=Cuscuta europaea TaxID=41803 RepID=A0A9P0YGV6_CUSEU|nr:unnamed protein product [Cuscuta europaea]
MSEHERRLSTIARRGRQNSRRASNADRDINDDINPDEGQAHDGHVQTPPSEQSDAHISVHGEGASSHAPPSSRAIYAAPPTQEERHNPGSLEVTPQSIHSDSEVLNRIKSIVCGHFTGPWSTYGEVPAATRELWWRLFKASHRWHFALDQAILKEYNSRISGWLRPTFRTAWSTGKKPKFLGDDVWEMLCRHWATDASFLLRSETGKANRNSEKAKEVQWHGGRKPQIQHKKDLEGSGPVKKRVTPLKLMAHCWTKKGAMPPPRLSEIEKKYEEERGKRVDELADSDDELDQGPGAAYGF